MASVNHNGSPDKSKRAALYVRVSSGPQEKDGTSLETQEAEALAYCGRQGYNVVAEPFREVQSGAYLYERQKLTDLRTLVRSGAVDVVVCHALDRLSRNQAHIYILAEEFENAGAHLEFVTETFEDSAVGKFMRSAKAFAAEVEREKFRERSQRGKRARVQAGRLLHGKTPMYGYAWNEPKTAYVLNTTTAPIVRRIYREAWEGRRLRSIAAGLSADGIPTPRLARIWDFTTVGRILRDPRYAGEAFAFRVKHVKEGGKSRHIARPEQEWVRLPEGTIPPLVDRATFDTVQARLRSNQEGASRRLSNPEDFLLRAGHIKCAQCGRAMAAHRDRRDGANFTRYMCTQGNRGSVECRRHTISARVLDTAVWRRVETLLTRPEVIADELRRLSKNDPTAADLAAIDRALRDIARKRANLAGTLALFSDPEAAAPIVEQIELLHRQAQVYTREREDVAGRHAAWLAGQQRIRDLETWCRRVADRLGQLSYDQKRTALEALGVEVRVWPSGHEPRYLITASIPLGPSTAPQIGQDSIFSDASQNIHS